MQKVTYFFWLCSGVHINLLKKCELESVKYVGIGATIFFTGVFAALAASYALFTVFDSAWIAIGLGLIWGLMIFNLDRYIVSCMRKERSFWREAKAALPRIVLGILISIVIAKPLEMKIFEKEIKSELILIEQQAYAAQENEIRTRFKADQEKNKSEIELFKSDIIAKAKLRDDLISKAQQEADGTGGSKIRNVGPIYKIKKADADRVSRELELLQKTNEDLIRRKRNQIAESDSLIFVETANLQRQRLDGPAARLEALDRLAARSDAAWWTNFFIVLLFLIVETAPILVKLISSQGAYDHVLKIEEYGFEAQRIERLARINAEIKRRTQDLPPAEIQFITIRLDMRLDQS